MEEEICGFKSWLNYLFTLPYRDVLNFPDSQSLHICKEILISNS